MLHPTVNKSFNFSFDFRRSDHRWCWPKSQYSPAVGDKTGANMSGAWQPCPSVHMDSVYTLRSGFKLAFWLVYLSFFLYKFFLYLSIFSTKLLFSIHFLKIKLLLKYVKWVNNLIIVWKHKQWQEEHLTTSNLVFTHLEESFKTANRYFVASFVLCLLNIFWRFWRICIYLNCGFCAELVDFYV